MPGGVIYDGSGWVVEHCVGPLGVGTVVVVPVRHVVHVEDLNTDEAAALGPLLRQTTAAVSAAVPAEQVYVCLWSHAGAVPQHIHFVVQPITRSQMDRFGALGPDLQSAMFRAGEPPDETEVETICDRLRTEFGLSAPPSARYAP